MDETTTDSSLNPVKPDQDEITTTEVSESLPNTDQTASSDLQTDLTPPESSNTIESEQDTPSQANPTEQSITDVPHTTQDEATPLQTSNTMESEENTISHGELSATDIPPITEDEATPFQTSNPTESEHHAEPTEQPISDIQQTTEDGATPMQASNTMKSEEHSTSPIESTQPPVANVSQTTEQESTLLPASNTMGSKQNVTSPTGSTEIPDISVSQPTEDETKPWSTLTDEELINNSKVPSSPSRNDFTPTNTPIQLGPTSSQPSSLSSEKNLNKRESQKVGMKSIVTANPVMSTLPSNPSRSSRGNVSEEQDREKQPVKNTKKSLFNIKLPHSKTPTDTSSTQPSKTKHKVKKSPSSRTGYQPTPTDPPEDIPSSTQKRKGFNSLLATNNIRSLYIAIPFLICALIALIISILEIIFGSKYYNKCSVDPYIPTYLNLAGILSIFTTILAIIMSIAFIVTTSEEKKSVKMLPIISKVLRVILIVTHVLLVIFLLSLFHHIFSIFKNVQYNHIDDSKTYCNKTFHRFAVVISIIHIADTIILCVSAFRISTK